MGVIKIPLTRGQVAIIDDADAHLAMFRWYANPRSDGRFYARKTDGKIYLHQAVMGTSGTLEVDHINGNTFDCRRCNLRTCTHLQNGKNITKRKRSSTGYKGVVFRGPSHPGKPPTQEALERYGNVRR